MSTLTQKQAAILANITARRLRQLDESNDGPPRDRQGGYPARPFAKWLRARMTSELGVASDGVRYDLQNERARHSKELADSRALANRVASGEWLSRRLLEQSLSEMFTVFRTRALGLPSKLAPLLDAQPATAIAAELDRELREMLEAFSTFRFEAAGTHEA
jgi:hypothetical protein